MAYIKHDTHISLSAHHEDKFLFQVAAQEKGYASLNAFMLAAARRLAKAKKKKHE